MQMAEDNIDKLFKTLNVTLVTSIGCGLLYVLGYADYQEYYDYFGINLAVRDLQLYEILKQGASQIPFIFLIFLISIITYSLLKNICKFVQKKANRLSALKTNFIAITISSVIFFIGFDLLIDSVKNIARIKAKKKIRELYKSGYKDSISLQNNNIVTGKCGFFFLTKNHVVFLRLSAGFNGKEFSFYCAVRLSYPVYHSKRGSLFDSFRSLETLGQKPLTTGFCC